MIKRVSLLVNDVAIQLDDFVEGYIDHVVGGIVASLKDTGEIERLVLFINEGGQVTLNLNNVDVPLKHFPSEIIKSTVLGMVSPLKGVGEINRLEMTISR